MAQGLLRLAVAMGGLSLAVVSPPQAQAQVPYTALAPPAVGASLCDRGICQAWALSRSRGQVTGRARPLQVLMIGDSLTQSGWIGQALQARLQAAGRAALVTSRGEQGADTRFLAGLGDRELTAMMAAVQPDLIIVAYGVNDGFRPDLERRAFEALLTDQVQRLRRLAPSSDLLILGAPEGLAKGKGSPCGASGYGSPWALPVVRDVQRQVAAQQGVAFWDWYGRMGGRCSAERLASQPLGWGAEPLMRGDRVHFSATGAAWIGRMLADDLLASGGLV